MRKPILLILSLLTLVVCAQDKLFTVNDAISARHLYPQGLYDLQFLPGGERYSQLRVKDEEQFIEIQEINEVSGMNILVSLSDINATLPEEYKLSRLPRANWISNNEFQFNAGRKVYAYHIIGKKTRDLEVLLYNGVTRPILFTDGSGYMATQENGFVFERNGLGDVVIDENKGIVTGQAVHRSEFGITNGLFPSPKYSKLAYYEMDETMVTEYPLYKLADTPATAKMLRYPTAGGKSHHVLVKVRNLNEDSAPVTIKTKGDPEQYLTNIAWTPDENYILIAIVNRAQNHMRLNLYNATSGDFVRTILEEKNERYVEPEHPAVFLKTNPNQFIWWSERDGYNHLYLYDLQGNLIQQLTKGDWVVTDYHGMSDDEKKLYITATKDSPLERHLYCVNTKNGKLDNLTQTPGYHAIMANEDCSMFIDRYSSVENPGTVRLIDGKGNMKGVLHQAENPIKDYKLGKMELGKLTGNSGDDLYYRVFKPIDFDPNKKYPVVVYLYNGPHLQLVRNSWLGGANLWYQYMAQNGYVVFSIDGRGSADRGFAFESAIHRNCGEKEMEDQLTGVEWLKKQPWVDADRLGIHGWSYGGFMTTSMMSRHPGVFQVGVAGGPVIDWSLYEVMYTERYMDSPQENPEGYAKTNLKNHVENLEGKLLMIHGGLDDVVLWQHSLQYLETAVDKGVQLDYFVYPKHKHNVYGQNRVHLYEKVSNYFFDHL